MVTLIIIALTSVVSVQAFKNSNLMGKYIFYPPAVVKGEWIRLVSYGLLHADYTHLIFNMLTLYFFGTVIENLLVGSFGTQLGIILYLIFYLSALVVSIIPTYIKEKNNYAYRGLGASGAVSAVVFAFILVNPMSYMGLMFIPIFLPAFLFGIIYVIISIYLTKNHGGNINHIAHIAGGVYGILLIVVLFFLLKDINLFVHFWQSIKINSISDLIRLGY